MTEAIQTKYRIIAAVDFSELADRALEAALGLCQMHEHAELHVITVGWREEDRIRLPGPKAELLLASEAEVVLGEHVQSVIGSFERGGRELGLERVALYATEGVASDCICALAASIDADLVVVGTNGRTGLERWVLGSVAEAVTRRAGCGVLVVKPRDFLKGKPLPSIDPPLKPGEHALKPFQHAPTYHYVVRGTGSSGRVMPIG
jgi:nucleotide-binding universal stress UspA family protein